MTTEDILREHLEITKKHFRLNRILDTFSVVIALSVLLVTVWLVFRMRNS